MIKPTVGRVVWFHPLAIDGADRLAGFAQAHDGRPMAAIIAHVWSDTMVNLLVIDPNGMTHSRTSVNLYQGGDEPRPQSGFAEWMPYQVGQAATFAAKVPAPASPAGE